MRATVLAVVAALLWSCSGGGGTSVPGSTVGVGNLNSGPNRSGSGGSGPSATPTPDPPTPTPTPDNSGCTVVATSLGTTYGTLHAARVGGGDHLSLTWAGTMHCDIGIYIAAGTSDKHLDHTTLSGFPLSLFVDGAGAVHVDHTNIGGPGVSTACDFTNITREGCSAGIYATNADDFHIDHTTVDAAAWGIVANATGTQREVQIDHTDVTHYSYNGMLFNDEDVSVQHSSATHPVVVSGVSPNGITFSSSKADQVEQNTALGNTWDFQACAGTTGINTAAALTAHHNTFSTFTSSC